MKRIHDDAAFLAFLILKAQEKYPDIKVKDGIDFAEISSTERNAFAILSILRSTFVIGELAILGRQGDAMTSMNKFFRRFAQTVLYLDTKKDVLFIKKWDPLKSW